jgi:hypothetical protein
LHEAIGQAGRDCNENAQATASRDSKSRIAKFPPFAGKPISLLPFAGKLV